MRQSLDYFSLRQVRHLSIAGRGSVAVRFVRRHQITKARPAAQLMKRRSIANRVRDDGDQLAILSAHSLWWKCLASPQYCEKDIPARAFSLALWLLCVYNVGSG